MQNEEGYLQKINSRKLRPLICLKPNGQQQPIIIGKGKLQPTINRTAEKLCANIPSEKVFHLKLPQYEFALAQNRAAWLGLFRLGAWGGAMNKA